MRLSAVNCILWACIATTLASNEVRSKRDLQYWKDVISSKLTSMLQANTTKQTPVEPILISNDGHAMIYRIPGYDDILIKAVPKTSVKLLHKTIPVPEKAVVVQEPTITVLKSYLGTKTPDETLSALQGVKNLLQSGVLLKPKPVAVNGSPKLPMIPVLPPPIPIPILSERFPVNPINVPQIVPYPVQNSYSYKQMKSDGTMMVYSAHGNGDVMVTETNKPMPPPPPYIMERFQQICRYKNLSRMQTIPINPPPPQIPNITIPKPVMYDINVPFPPIRTMVDVPPVEVNPFSYQQLYNHADIVIQEPILLPPPPTYVLNRIEKVAATASKVPQEVPEHAFNWNGGTYDKNTDQSRITKHAQAHALRGSVFFQPSNSRYVYRQVNHIVPNRFNVGNLEDPSHHVNELGHVKVNSYPKKYEYVFPTNPKVHPFTPGKYFYKQVHQDGTITTYSGAEEQRDTPLVAKTEPSQVATSPSIQLVTEIGSSAIIPNATEEPKTSSGYSFKITNDASVINTVGDTTPYGQSTPTQTTVTTDIPKINKILNRVGYSKYSYRKIRNGTVTVVNSGNSGIWEQNPALLVSKTRKNWPPPPRVYDRIKGIAVIPQAGQPPKIPVHSFTLTSEDNVHPEPSVPSFTQPPNVSSGYSFKLLSANVNNPDKGIVTQATKTDTEDTSPETFKGTVTPSRPGVVMFSHPVPSAYIYKQINHNNPMPFTVVKVEDKPVLDEEISIKVNTHGHVREDGAKYLSNKVHETINDNVQVINVPKDFVYVPPEVTDEPVPIFQEDNMKSEPKFSYKQITNHGVFSNKDGLVDFKTNSETTSTVSENLPTENTATALTNLNSLANNPIVVIPEAINYSFTQSGDDGSKIKVSGNSENIISIEVKEPEGKSVKTNRGDIPETLS